MSLNNNNEYIAETINRYVDIYLLYIDPIGEFEEFVRRIGMEHILIHTPLIDLSGVSIDYRAIDRRTMSANNVFELDYYSAEIQALILIEIHTELLRYYIIPSIVTHEDEEELIEVDEVSIDDSEVSIVIYSLEM
jgi:hypothetical protein